MKRKGTRRITALLLTTALCAGLCTGLTANAGEADAETKSQVEQTETVPKEEVSSENLPEEAGTNETEEPGTSGETGQEEAGASEEPEEKIAAGKKKTVTITAMATDGSNKKAVVKIKLK